MAKTNPDSLAAIVLCGGKSSRMGYDKSQLVFGDANQQSTFLSRIVSAINENVEKVIVVCDANHRQQPAGLPDDVIVTCDRTPDCGPLEGIAAGLAALPSEIESAFVTSCDVPGICADIIPLLAAQLGDHDAVIPVDDARVYGLTAIYRRRILPKLDELIQRGQLKVSEIPYHIRANQIPLDLMRTVDPKLDSLANINTLADYRALAERIGFQIPDQVQERTSQE